jgi:hypothetical protein
MKDSSTTSSTSLSKYAAVNNNLQGEKANHRMEKSAAPPIRKPENKTKTNQKKEQIRTTR